MLIEYEAYCIKGIEIIIFNPIPITNNLAIQRTSLFAAFNNCTYCNTYTDDCYETSWHPWYTRTGTEVDNLNLMYKEGVFYTGKTQNPSGGSGSTAPYTTNLYKFPQYFWKRQYIVTEFENQWSQGKIGQAGVFDTFNSQAQRDKPIPAGLVWDPYERPEHIGELRAGKNACTFSWTPHPCDENKIFNLDRIADYATWTTAGPYIGCHRIGTGRKFLDMDPEVVTTYGAHARDNTAITPPEIATAGNVAGQFEDYTIPNWSFIPICPNAWFWQEIKNSIADFNMNKAWQKIDKYWAGTETEHFKYPPHQMFIKGIPLYDSTASQIRTLTQVSCKVTLKLGCKKRRSAYYCPTWGPFSGEQLYYHNEHKLIFQENYIRYRTGGQRRTWQNLNRTNIDQSKKIHGREDCYGIPKNDTEITSEWYDRSTFPVPIDAGLQGLAITVDDDNRNDIQITLQSDGTSTVRYKPTAPKRAKQKSPEKYADVQMLEHLPQM